MERGLQLGGVLRESDLAAGPPFERAGLVVDAARLPDGYDMEARVAVMESPDAYVVVTMLTPARGQDFLKWAVNRRSFTLVTSSVDLQ